MPDSCWATQSLDVTVATGISFWRSIFGWKGTGDYPATSLFGVTLGSTLVYYDSLTATTSGEITSATTGWENIIIDVSSYSGANDFTFIAYATADQNTYALQVLIDDVVLLPSSIVSATIEDSSKTWTADQFNTNGMFILTSGDVKGFSASILDTFENYIQVPTTFANVINNITHTETLTPISNGDFETGDFTGWSTSVLAYGTWANLTTVECATEYASSGDYGVKLSVATYSGIIEETWTYATLSQEVSLEGATGISFDYKINTIINNKYQPEMFLFIDYIYDGDVIEGRVWMTSVDNETEWITQTSSLWDGEHDIIIDDTYATTATIRFHLLGAALLENQYLETHVDNFELLGSNTIGDTYLITYTPTEWLTATATIFTFNTECGKNATTLGNINYGDGGLTLEFVENIGTYTGLTWTINKDVFFADVNQDYSRIASIVRGKGTKLCTGTVYSYLSDNTYALTVSTIGDTFLRTAATAGADKIYVYDNTHFGTAYGYGSNFSLIVGHGETQEWLEISATGANGECTILPYGTTSYAHSVLEDVMNQGCFYATGSKEEVDNFMLALENTWMGYNWQNLSVFIGSEIVYLNCDNGTPYVRLNDNTVKMFMETLWRDDSYGYAYPHAPGAPVVAAVYFGGGLQNPDSLMARYGYREAHVNPVGIVDPDSMDKLCYNSLMSGTPNGTWGRVMMPASLLPATVDIGDWVNIAEADLSATTCYQIVGLEYDQKKGVFWIELGSTEDYYLESIAGNRGTFDLSLSNY